MALTVAIVCVSLIVVAFIVGSGSDDAPKPEADFREPIADVVQPVGAANDALSDDLEALDPGDRSGPALVSARVAMSDTRDARLALARLDLPAPATGLLLDTQNALDRELTYLAAVRRALRSSSPSGMTARGTEARAAWRPVTREIPGAGGRIAGFDTAAAWARAAGTDGDAGPGVAGDSRGADEALGVPDAPAVRSCGGYEGIYDVVAEGVSCGTAVKVAFGSRTSKSAAGADGYICEPGGKDELGGTRFTCDGPAGERVSYSANIG